MTHLSPDERWRSLHRPEIGVLILVLVEYTVTAILVLRASSMKGLNPCFSGIYRDMPNNKGSSFNTISVLILVLVEYTVTLDN